MLISQVYGINAHESDKNTGHTSDVVLTELTKSYKATLNSKFFLK